MKELTIKLRLDRSHERQQAAEAMADARKLEATYKSATATRTSSGKAAADAERKFHKDVADAARQSAKEQSDAGKQVADVRKKFAKDQSDAARKAAKDQAKADAEMAKSAKKSAAEAAKAWKAQAEEHNEGLAGNVLSVGKLAGAYGAFTVATHVVGAITEMWKAQRKDIEESIQRMGQYRNIILELATLNDRLGRTTPELKNQLEFRAKTLQGKTDAIAFQGGAMDAGQVAMKAGLIAPGEFKKLTENIGSIQGATGANPEGLGLLTGMMPGLIGGKNQSAEGVTQRTAGILDILRLGVGGLKSGVGQFAATSGMTKSGMFKSPEEQAALQSYFSLTQPESAGNLVEQFVRGTVGMTTKARGSSLEGSETQVEYGKSLGVTDDMKPMEIGRKIAADLAKQKATNPDFNTKAYLTRHGITDQYAQDALIDYSTGVNSGSFDQAFGKMSRGEAVPTFASAMREADVHKAVDPTAQERKRELATNLADATRGSGSEAMFDDAKRIAFENLRLQGKTYGKYEDQNGSTLWEGQILDEVQRMTAEAMKSVGLDPAAVGEQNPRIADALLRKMGFGAGDGVLGGSFNARLPGFGYSNEDRAKAYGEFATQIREKGGDPLEILKQMLDNSKKQLELTEKMENRAAAGVPNRVAAPAPAPPPAPLRGAPAVPVR